MDDLIYTDYMKVSLGVVKSGTVGVGRDWNTLCGLVGYLASQEHFMREPILARMVSIALVKNNISVIWNKRYKPDPVGDLLAQCLIVKAWSSPIGRYNGMVEFADYEEDNEEPKAS